MRQVLVAIRVQGVAISSAINIVQLSSRQRLAIWLRMSSGLAAMIY